MLTRAARPFAQIEWRQGSGVNAGLSMASQAVARDPSFFTVTGRALNGAPCRIQENQEGLVWLCTLLSKNHRDGQPERIKADLRHQKTVPPGERHFFWQSVAAQFGAKGMAETEILEALNAINRQRCSPPKPHQVLRELATWATRLTLGSTATGDAEPIDALVAAHRLW